MDLLEPRLKTLRQDWLIALREEVLRLLAGAEDMEAQCRTLNETYDPEAAAREWRRCLQEGTVQEKREAIQALVDYGIVLGKSEVELECKVDMSWQVLVIGAKSRPPD